MFVFRLSLEASVVSFQHWLVIIVLVKLDFPHSDIGPTCFIAGILWLFLLMLLNFVFSCEQFKPASLLRMKLSMLASAWGWIMLGNLLGNNNLAAYNTNLTGRNKNEEVLFCLIISGRTLEVGLQTWQGDSPGIRGMPYATPVKFH